MAQMNTRSRHINYFNDKAHKEKRSKTILYRVRFFRHYNLGVLVVLFPLSITAYIVPHFVCLSLNLG